MLSDEHLSEDTIIALDSDLEGDDDREFESLRFFKLGKESPEFLIEVPVDDEDWEEVTPEDLFALLKYANDGSCSWALLGPERGVNKDLPTFPPVGSPSYSE
jgi:hypothetical protein